MSKEDDLKRYRENWENEVNGMMLYSAMADAEKKPKHAELYRRLAAIEGKHVKFWEGKLDPKELKSLNPTLRTRVLMRLAHWFGPNLLLPIVASSERENKSTYDAQPEA